MKSNSRDRTRPKSVSVPGAGHNGFTPRHSTTVAMVPLERVSCTRRQLKRFKPDLIELHCANIRAIDLIPPILVDGTYNLVHGLEIYLAAKELGVSHIPVIVMDHLSEAEIGRYRLFLTKGVELSTWDADALKLEFDFILDSGEDLDLSLSGFTLPEIDNLLLAPATDSDDDIPEPQQEGVTTRGDLWLLDGGTHRILCGSALDAEDYQTLMQGERAQMVVADPPYGVPIQGHVSGLGKKTHAEFVQGSKSMSREELEQFLRESFLLMKLHSVDGAVHAIWMDWRGMQQILAAAEGVYHQTLNMCVWDKQRGGMGSLYRSQHELCFIFKTTDHPHRNNVELGKNGRTRSNVWSYPGLAQMGPSRARDLADHPTIKPTGLIYEIIRDVATRNNIVLDPFLGSGTTIIAAHRAHRRGFGMDLDPRYVDIALRRISERTGLTAVLAETGESFAEVTARRAAEVTASEEVRDAS